MPKKRPRRPKDPNQLAKMMIDLATMDEVELKAHQAKQAAKKRARSTRRQRPGKEG